MQFSDNVNEPRNFYFTEIPDKSYDAIFLKSPKTKFLGHFWSFLPDRDFFQKIWCHMQLKIYRKKSSSILLRKNMFNSLLAFCLWKACTFSCFERFICWKSTNFSQIYLSGIINYWGSILTLYITWGTFSLVCVLSVFFSFFVFPSFFYRYFPWQTLTNQKIGRERESLFFLFFHFHPLTNIHLIHRDFYHLFFLDLFAITMMRLVLLRYLHFTCILMKAIKSELLTYKVTLSGCELISNYRPSITKPTP